MDMSDKAEERYQTLLDAALSGNIALVATKDHGLVIVHVTDNHAVTPLAELKADIPADLITFQEDTGNMPYPGGIWREGGRDTDGIWY